MRDGESFTNNESAFPRVRNGAIYGDDAAGVIRWKCCGEIRAPVDVLHAPVRDPHVALVDRIWREERLGELRGDRRAPLGGIVGIGPENVNMERLVGPRGRIAEADIYARAVGERVRVERLAVLLLGGVAEGGSERGGRAAECGTSENARMRGYGRRRWERGCGRQDGRRRRMREYGGRARERIHQGIAQEDTTNDEHEHERR